jgi:Rps23 Pro-64 3,4-dihydroxylase Tpa1-like proline 4-hydroxylase
MNTTLIPLDDLQRSFLINEGAYCGNLFDFLESSEIEYLKTLIANVKEYATKERDTELYCRYDYELRDGGDGGINENDNFEHSIKLSEVSERDLFVKENERGVLQKWFEFDGFNNDCKYFFTISKKILSYFYPNEKIDYNYAPHFTLYEDGHFIGEHNDGENVGRICGLIIYLSYEEDYNDGGGELVIQTNSNKTYSIKPIFGTFSLLDFTQNNIKHSVNVVKNGFKRYSFIYFFNTIPNKDTHKQKLI